MPWCMYCGQSWTMPEGPTCGCVEREAEKKREDERKLREKIREIVREELHATLKGGE